MRVKVKVKVPVNRRVRVNEWYGKSFPHKLRVWEVSILSTHSQCIWFSSKVNMREREFKTTVICSNAPTLFLLLHIFLDMN